MNINYSFKNAEVNKFRHMPLMRSVVLERVYTRREALAQKN